MRTSGITALGDSTHAPRFSALVILVAVSFHFVPDGGVSRWSLRSFCMALSFLVLPSVSEQEQQPQKVYFRPGRRFRHAAMRERA